MVLFCCAFSLRARGPRRSPRVILFRDLGSAGGLALPFPFDRFPHASGGFSRGGRGACRRSPFPREARVGEAAGRAAQPRRQRGGFAHGDHPFPRGQTEVHFFAKRGRARPPAEPLNLDGREGDFLTESSSDPEGKPRSEGRDHEGPKSRANGSWRHRLRFVRFERRRREECSTWEVRGSKGGTDAFEV